MLKKINSQLKRILVLNMIWFAKVRILKLHYCNSFLVIDTKKLGYDLLANIYYTLICVWSFPISLVVQLALFV